MRGMLGLIRWGLPIVLLALVPDASGSDLAYDPKIVARYQGTYTSFVYTASSVDSTGKATFLSPRTESWTWSYVWTGRLSVLHNRRPFRFTEESLSGTVERIDELPGQRSGNCRFTYGPKSDVYPLNAPVQVPFIAGKGYAWKEGSITFIQFPPLQTQNVIVRSQADPKKSGACSNVIGPSASMAARFPPSMGKVFQFVDLSLPSVRARRFDLTVKPPDGQPAEHETLKSSITLTIGGAGSGSGSAPAPAVDPKAVARSDLRRSLEQASGPCLQLAISLGVISAGSVWAFVGAPVPGGLPAGGALIATGAVMGSAMAPLCTEYIKQVVVDYSIVKRDPPVPRAIVPLRLPSCTRYQEAVRAYCVRLSAAVVDLVAAELDVLPVLKNLQSAATKLSAARKNGNAQAVTDAQARVNTVVRSFRSMRATSSAAGKKVASIVKAAGIQGKLTKKQSAATIEALLMELAKRGVPAADLRKIAPSALKPRAVDVLAALKL